jgi:hypothetical protein
MYASKSKMDLFVLCKAYATISFLNNKPIGDTMFQSHPFGGGIKCRLNWHMSRGRRQITLEVIFKSLLVLALERAK